MDGAGASPEKVDAQRHHQAQLTARSKALVEFLKTRIEAGEFRAVIDREYQLEDIADAYRYVETERKTGIVVIKVRLVGE
jgi:NADPH:quinone reductase-like Zn-dependent oxidoreductase